MPAGLPRLLPHTPGREDLATLRLPDLMQAYGEVLSGRGPQNPPAQALFVKA